LIVEAEAARVHGRWYDRFQELYDPRTAELVERGRKVSGEALGQALAGRENLRRELTELMDRHRVDLWISPSAPGAAPRGLDSTGDPVMNLPWTHSGLPTLQLPSGENAEGLPLGLQIAARGYADEALFAWARELEGAVTKRPCPEASA
jgi:Asp-tRNA(Asn)/Glu-tRNA(Gln) amidotransferase A subunit family amidase